MRCDAFDPKHILIEDISDILKKIQCKTVDPTDGNMITFTMHSWLFDGMYDKYTLVILGKPGLGKTPCAQALCAHIAKRLQKYNQYYILVGTVDGLSKAQAQGLQADNVPIVLDDCTPALPRGSRPAMTAEELKHNTNVVTSDTLAARLSLGNNDP